MEIQNNNNKNNFKNYLSWINSVDIPLSKACSNINDLKNGDIFLEVLKFFFKNNKKNQNYLLLINSLNKVNTPIEKINLVFQILSKLTNNNKIKSRIETFHSNINEFMKRDDLIFEFLMYFIHIIDQNKHNNRKCKIHERQNKNNSCVQLEKYKKILNLDNSDKYQREIVDYKSAKNENNKRKSQEVNNKNNFLFYINNENENIINIDNNMNFRFTNGINNLKAKCNNCHHIKEIKSYATKQKIIKYESQNFNHQKEPIKNIKNKRNAKSETCNNNLKVHIKEEKKIDLAREKESKNVQKLLYDYYTFKPEKNNSVTNIKPEEKKLNIEQQTKTELEKGKKLELQKQNDLKYILNNQRNLSTKNKTIENNSYKLLKLTNSKLNNSKQEKLKENKKEEKEEKEKENSIYDSSENNRAKSQKGINNSTKKESNNNVNSEKLDKPILIINNKETIETNKVKRHLSNSKKISERQLNDINNDSNKKTHKSYSYLEFDINKSIIEDYIKDNINNKEKIHLNNINIKIKQKNREIDKEKIILWLYNLKLINGSEVNLINLPQIISDGKLLCDIINLFENKNNKIEGISKEVSIKENALMNIQKALEHLNKIEDFPKDNISSYEPIFEIDSLIIWELLDDLYNYYSNRIELKQLNRESISTNISINNNNSKINKNKGKSLKHLRKKNMSDISDEFFDINDIKKNKNFSNKNNIKNKIFKKKENDKNELIKDNRTFSSNNNKTNYKYSYENLSMVNNKENRPNNNNSNMTIYQENEEEYKKMIHNKDKKRNYIYYVNEFNHYFGKEKESKEELKKNVKTIDTNKTKNEYKENKNESYYPNNNFNNLYFNYSNSTFFNRINKKTKYPFNPINPNYYKLNRFSTLNNAITINQY